MPAIDPRDDHQGMQVTPPDPDQVAHCPECGGPATVIDRLVLYRTTGPVLHLRTACDSPVHFQHCDEDPESRDR